MKDYDSDDKLMKEDSGVFGISKRFEWSFVLVQSYFCYGTELKMFRRYAR